MVSWLQGPISGFATLAQTLATFDGNVVKPWLTPCNNPGLSGTVEMAIALAPDMAAGVLPLSDNICASSATWTWSLVLKALATMRKVRSAAGSVDTMPWVSELGHRQIAGVRTAAAATHAPTWYPYRGPSPKPPKTAAVKSESMARFGTVAEDSPAIAGVGRPQDGISGGQPLGERGVESHM